MRRKGLFNAMALIMFCAWEVVAKLSVQSGFEEVPERGRVQQWTVEFQKDRFRMTPPNGWTVEVVQSEDRVLFRNERVGAAIGLRFSEGSVARDAKELLGQIEQRFAGVQLQEGFPAVARDAQGIGMNGRFEVGSSLFDVRAAAFSYGDTGVQIVLTAPAGMLQKVHPAWTTVLSSLHRVTPDANLIRASR